MRQTLLSIAILLAAALAGCGENEPPASTPSPGTLAPSTPAPTQTAARSTPAPAVNNNVVAPPKDARYTLFCQDIEGPDHTELANHQKQLWQQATGRREWYVIHQENDSILYFGYYRAYNDPKDPQTQQAQSDHQYIASLKNSVGDEPFAHSLFVPLDAPDPTAPPEWNLLNAKGFWSVEIGTCTGPDRKARAVDAVRDARAAGVEAYYFHGDGVSSICIGVFPEEAVAKQQAAVAKNNNANGGIAVVPGPIAGQVPPQVFNQHGQPMNVMSVQLVVQDPAMIAVMNQYPLHSVNGMEYPGKPSGVVQIPKKKMMNDEPMLTNRPNVDLLGGSSSESSSTPGGRLRSLGN